MPTYVYRCNDCGREFEEFQTMTEKPLETCPSCKGKAQRIISGGAGFLFKGPGFYSTDYRSDSYKKSAAADTGGNPPTSSSSSSSSGPSSDAKSKKPSSND